MSSRFPFTHFVRLPHHSLARLRSPRTLASISLALTICLSIAAGTLVHQAHANAVGYPNVFTFTSTDASANYCEVLQSSGSTALSSQPTQYVPPNTVELSIVARGGAGHPGDNQGFSTSGGAGGKGAVVTASFPYSNQAVYIQPGTANGNPGTPIGLGGAGLAAVDGSYSAGGNAALVATGSSLCDYSASNLLVAAGGGGGGGGGSTSHGGGTGGDAGPNANSGETFSGADGTHGGQGISGEGGRGASGGPDFFTGTSGGNGGSGGSCSILGSGHDGHAGSYLQGGSRGGGAELGDGDGGAGGGGYYSGGGGGGGVCDAGGGGGGGGASYISFAQFDDNAPVTLSATNTSTTSSVTVRALTPLTVTANDKTYIYGSGVLPAFDATYTGFISHQADGSNVDTSASLGGTLTFTTSASSSSRVGNYAITADSATLTSPDYVISYAPGTLHILAAHTSTATSGLLKTVVGAALPVSATVAPVSPSTATVNEGTVSFVLEGANGARVGSTGAAGSAAVSNGTASISLDTSGITPGAYTLVATYNDPFVNGQNPNYVSSSAQGTVFLLNPGVSLSSSDVATASGGTASAAVDSGKITASGSGSGTLVLGQYSADPQVSAPKTSVNAYFDAYVPSSSSFSSVTVTDCDLNSGQVVYWWNGTTWAPVSNETYDSATRCATVTINGTTSPTILQLSGTPFGISKADTTTTLSADHNPSVVGQPVTFQAYVTAQQPGGGVPTGAITFSVNGSPITCASGNQTLDGSGAATCGYSLSPAGDYSVGASYSGDSSFNGSSDTQTQRVGQADTTTKVSSSANPSMTGQSVTYTASVSVVSPGAGAPTGTVAFSDSGGSLPSNCATAALSGGMATCTVTYSATGSHTIGASYSGDANFKASSTSALTQSIDTSLGGYPQTNGAYNLGNTNLAGAYLAGANLSEAKVSNTNLTNASLNGANLTGANLTSSNLKGANLTNANLTGANLAQVNLKGANLTGANLTGATRMSSANLSGVTWSNTTCPDGSNSNAHNNTCAGHL